jgi:hypothetical protein
VDFRVSSEKHFIDFILNGFLFSSPVDLFRVFSKKTFIDFTLNGLLFSSLVDLFRVFSKKTSRSLASVVLYLILREFGIFLVSEKIIYPSVDLTFHGYDI